LVLNLNPAGNEYSEQEILKFLEKRKGQLEGVCITGGEPLLTIDMEFLKKIKNLGYLIKIDTNGSFPELLEELIKKGLIDYVSMDIKASKINYEKIANCKIDIKKIEKSIRIISLLLNEYEFRTTALEDLHDIEEMKEIAKWLNQLCSKKPKKFALQGFKNKGKFIDNSFKAKKDTKESYLKELKNILREHFEEIEVRV
jgi:pyruvate formate lyase activating enzyme